MKSLGLFILIGLLVLILQLSRHASSFMPVNVINLTRSTNRLQNMTLQCYAYGIPFIRHPAVDGNTYNFTDKDKEMLFGLALQRQKNIKIQKFKHTSEEQLALYTGWEKEKSYKKTKRIMACSLSHIQIWMKYKHAIDPYIMILEDDGIIQSNIRQHVNTCIRALDAFDPEWHIVWLSGKDPKDREQVLHWNYYNVYRMDPPDYVGQGAGAYILSRKGLQHFLDVLDKNGCADAADYFLFKTLVVKHSYGVHPPLVDIHHNTTPSTIV